MTKILTWSTSNRRRKKRRRSKTPPKLPRQTTKPSVSHFHYLTLLNRFRHQQCGGPPQLWLRFHARPHWADHQRKKQRRWHRRNQGQGRWPRHQVHQHKDVVGQFRFYLHRNWPRTVAYFGFRKGWAGRWRQFWQRRQLDFADTHPEQVYYEPVQEVLDDLR